MTLVSETHLVDLTKWRETRIRAAFRVPDRFVTLPEYPHAGAEVHGRRAYLYDRGLIAIVAR